MTHYDKEREADELWRNAPEGATHYASERFWRETESYSWNWYRPADNSWLKSVSSPHNYKAVLERPQHITKQPETAQDASKQPDPVNHPKHYTIAPGVEAIDIIKESLTPEQFEGYLLGNFLKYRLRAGDKDDLQQDIAKSNWYRERLNQR